jgi:hypothetical protein
MKPAPPVTRTLEKPVKNSPQPLPVRNTRALMIISKIYKTFLLRKLKCSVEKGLARTVDWYYATKSKKDVAEKMQTLLHEKYCASIVSYMLNTSLN